MVGSPEEAEVRTKTNLLLGGAAVALLISGAIAQTTQRVERIKDAAGQSQAVGARGDDARKTSGTPNQAEQSQTPSESKKTVRTVYPNTQNAEQAARESKTAQGGADASKRQPGDVTPVSAVQPPAAQASTS